MKTVPIAIWVCLIWVQAALATPLEDRRLDFSLDTPVDSIRNVDSYTSGGALLVTLARGYLEPGVEFSYGRDEFEPVGGHNARGMTYGPRMDVNFTPWFPATPFASFSYLRFAGDLSDLYDYGYGFRFGIKVFPSPWASVSLLGRSERWNAKTGGVNSAVRQIAVGVSLYFSLFHAPRFQQTHSQPEDPDAE
jgi:hypothetical protein